MAYKFRKSRLQLDGKFMLAIFAVIFMIIGAAAYVIINSTGVFYVASLPELSITGYSQVSVSAEVSGDSGVITIASGCREITAYTEPYQAESIAMGQAGYVDVRPNTHDLIKDAFESLGVDVVMLKINEVRNGTFIGRFIIRSGNRIVNLDAKPSDGTAIAARMNAPVYINDSLLEEYGKDVC